MKSQTPFFIHISKNAGTSVEEVFKSKGILLGRYDPFYKKHNLHWHTPPSAFTKCQKDLFQKEISSKTTFIIHRSPFQRVLSEMNCKWGNPQKKNQGSRRKFNNNLRQYLISVFLRRLHNKLYTLLVQLNFLNPVPRDHWIPQSHYLKYFSAESHKIKVVPFEFLSQGVSEIIGRQLTVPKINEQASSFKHDSSSISNLNKALIILTYTDDLINHKRLLKKEQACVCSGLITWKNFSFNSKWDR